MPAREREKRTATPEEIGSTSARMASGWMCASYCQFCGGKEIIEPCYELNSDGGGFGRVGDSGCIAGVHRGLPMGCSGRMYGGKRLRWTKVLQADLLGGLGVYD